MGFRDDNEALRQRVRALEGQVETLTEELAEERTAEPIKVRVEDELEARIREQEAEARAKPTKRAVREPKGRREAVIAQSKEGTMITIKRTAWRQLVVKLRRLLALAPSALVLAMFITSVQTCGESELVRRGVLLDVLPWCAAAYVLFMLVYAWRTRPQMELRIGEANFELKNKGESRMIGRRKQLRVSVHPRVSSRSPAKLVVSHGDEEFVVDELSEVDVKALLEVL